MRFLCAAACAAMLLSSASFSAMAVDVGAYIKKDRFNTLKISPTGEYYAATVPLEDKTALAILRRSDNKLMTTFRLGKNTHVQDFEWVNSERVLLSVAEKFGALDQPLQNGNIYAINADGGQPDILVGWKVNDAGPGTTIKPKKRERVFAVLFDALPNDDRHVLVAIYPDSEEPYTRVDRMDVYSGRRETIAKAPIRNASFVTDNDGVVRFSKGSNSDRVNKLYYRVGEGKEWTLVNDESASGHDESAIGFSSDNLIAYLWVEQATGPSAIVAMDVANGTRKEILRDDDTDPHKFIRSLGKSDAPVGAVYMDGKPRTAFFDKASPEARLYRSLEAAFAGEPPFITSTTDDGRLTLVETSSDRNPGDFYVFDTVAKKADHMISRREWFDPAKTAEMRPISLTARDGQSLKGYVTLPNGSAGKNLPMVVMPHGGPFGVYERWGFEDDSQLLAAAGYAVLQLDFRGSGNHGRAFLHAGANQWGGKMQDDVTDATRWAIQQGIADSGRICIYGASYGAYAALMGVAKEPGLYKCAVGYVGVYDLPTMHTHGDVQRRGSGETYLREWIGEKNALASVSPNRMADRIKVPVFLAAGGEDERAPIEHSKLMESALKKAGVPVETLYFPTEGHGFYVDAHRQEFYTRLLAFLARNIGGATATAPAPATGK